MQISSNLVGFNFKSVYQSIVTRHDQPVVDQSASRVAADEAAAHDDNLAQAEMTHRETQLLQAAQRAAERTADAMDRAPDL